MHPSSAFVYGRSARSHSSGVLRAKDLFGLGLFGGGLVLVCWGFFCVSHTRYFLKFFTYKLSVSYSCLFDLPDLRQDTGVSWANSQHREFLMVRVRDVVGSFASPPLLPPWSPLWYLLYYAFKFLKSDFYMTWLLIFLKAIVTSSLAFILFYFQKTGETLTLPIRKDNKTLKIQRSKLRWQEAAHSMWMY